MRSKLLKAGFFLLLLIFPLIVGITSPNVDNEETICPFLRFFNIPCFGCGITKSIIHLYNGEFAESFAYHYWTIPIVLFSFTMVCLLISDIITKKNISDKLLDNYKMWQCLAVLFAITYIIRLWQHFTI